MRFQLTEKCIDKYRNGYKYANTQGVEMCL